MSGTDNSLSIAQQEALKYKDLNPALEWVKEVTRLSDDQINSLYSNSLSLFQELCEVVGGDFGLLQGVSLQYYGQMDSYFLKFETRGEIFKFSLGPTFVGIPKVFMGNSLDGLPIVQESLSHLYLNSLDRLELVNILTSSSKLLSYKNFTFRFSLEKGNVKLGFRFNSNDWAFADLPLAGSASRKEDSKPAIKVNEPVVRSSLSSGLRGNGGVLSWEEFCSSPDLLSKHELSQKYLLESADLDIFITKVISNFPKVYDSFMKLFKAYAKVADTYYSRKFERNVAVFDGVSFSSGIRSESEPILMNLAEGYYPEKWGDKNDNPSNCINYVKSFFGYSVGLKFPEGVKQHFKIKDSMQSGDYGVPQGFVESLKQVHSAYLKLLAPFEACTHGECRVSFSLSSSGLFVVSIRVLRASLSTHYVAFNPVSGEVYLSDINGNCTLPLRGITIRQWLTYLDYLKSGGIDISGDLKDISLDL